MFHGIVQWKFRRLTLCAARASGLVAIACLAACETAHHVPAEGPVIAGKAPLRNAVRKARVSRPPAVSISVSPTQINIGENAWFTVTLSHATGASPITVNFITGGTAALGSDYQLQPSSSRVVIPARSTSAVVTLTAGTAANAPESNTTTLTIRSGSGYKLASSGTKSTVVILNASATPTPTPAASPTPSPTPSGSPTPTPEPVGHTEAWIAIRADGLPGTGTQADPYDGSTPEKFDVVMSRLQWVANPIIHLMGAGPFRSDANHDWYIRSNWTVTGDGMDVTTVQMVGSIAAYTGGVSLFRSDPNYATDGVIIRDLTIDCNWAEVGPTAPDGESGEKNIKTGAITICGSNNLVDHVHCKNSYGSIANKKEHFAMFLMGPRNGDGTNNIFQYCHVDFPQGNYGNPYALAGWVHTTPKYLLTNSKVLSCTAAGNNDGGPWGFNSGGVNIANVKDCTVDGNTFIDCYGAAYTDTGSIDGLWITNNRVVRGWQVVGLAGYDQPKQNIHISGNDFQVQNRDFQGVSEAILVSYGATTNLTIENNMITFDTTGAGRQGFWGIWVGPVTNAVIRNNTIAKSPWPIDNHVDGSGLTISNNRAPDGTPANGL